MVLVIGLTMRRAIPLFQAMQKKVDRINQVMRETLAGVRVIRAFVRTAHEEQRFDDANLDLFGSAIRVNRLFAVTIPVLTLIMNLSTVAVMWFGAMRVADGAMGIGNLTAFLQYLLLIMFSVLTAVLMFILVPARGGLVGAHRGGARDRSPSIHDPADARRAPGSPRTGAWSSSATSAFSYPGAEQPVLSGISFRAAPGKTTAIVGSTGSGKSTLINLIPRLVRRDRRRGPGRRRRRPRDGPRGPLGAHRVRAPEVVPVQRHRRQQPALRRRGRHRTRSCGAPSTSPRVATSWPAMDGQLEAAVTQGGTNVSGGQRQRLAIARAIVRKAGIFVFDDSFSALDFATDARLRAALSRELADATVIIVAQRVGTIMNADQIVVMDGGRVVGIGTHSQLLATNETYQEIVYSQLSREEAAA